MKRKNGHYQHNLRKTDIWTFLKPKLHINEVKQI